MPGGNFPEVYQKINNMIFQLLNESLKEKEALNLLASLIKGSKFNGKVYLAGGAVRDELLGLDPKDIDVVVELPDGGIEFANWITKKLGIYKEGSNPVIYPTFGTAKFTLRGIHHNNVDLSDVDIEAVMTRKEKYTAGSRKPEVDVGGIKDDVERRDFTVNSLLKDLSTGEILDLTGMGRSDIKQGIIRTPLNPDIIFSEDPLRMLRAIRFTVKYNWKLPLFMIRALKKNASMLKNISTERIRDELSKILITKYPDKGVRLLQLTNLSKYIFPELDDLIKLQQNRYHSKDAMGHTLDVVKQIPPTLVKRLSALLHDVGKSTTKKVIDNEVHFYEHENIGANMAREILTRLRYPNDIIDSVVFAIKNHMRTKSFGDEEFTASDKALRKLKFELGSHLEDTLDLIHADNLSHKIPMTKQVPNIKSRLAALDNKQTGNTLPLSGDDLIKYFNLKPGKKIGELLSILRDKWLDDPAITKARAIEYLKKYV